MRILIVFSGFYMGGFSKSLLNLLKCAEKYDELDIHVLALGKSTTHQESEIPARFTYTEYESLAAEPPVSRGVNYRYIFNVQRIRNLEYKFKERYYHLRNRQVPETLKKRFIQYSWMEKANRVTESFAFAEDYDCVVSWEEGFCNYLLVDKIPAKHKIGYIHPNYKEINLSARADRKYIKVLDRIVVISQSCYDTLVDVFPKYRDKIAYIPNRLHIDSILQQSLESHPFEGIEKPIILTVCRIVDYDKAVFRIVKLAKRLQKDGVLFTWYIIGDGIDLPELKRRIAESKLNEQVICLGEIINPYPYMRQADLFVMQSHREGRPVAVDEAMVLGTPALVTSYSSAAEQVVDGVTGWIADNDEQDIYAKLKNALTSDGVLNRIKQSLAKINRDYYEDCLPFIELLRGVIKG